MGFFDTILGMFGIGQPKLAMTISRTEAGPGAVIDAVLTLTGGNRPLALNAFSLELVESEDKANAEGVKSTYTNRIGTVELPQGGQTIAPGQVISFKMRTQVPKDARPTGGNVRYKVVGTADVPGLDADASQPIVITSTPDAWATEDLSRYYVVDQELSYRNSSVKSDFRILRLPDGFVVTWKNELSCRGFDGAQRWRLPGWGRSFTLSPDGTQILASNQQKELAIINAADGTIVRGPMQLPNWPGDMAWLEGDALVIDSGSGISMMQPNFFPIGVSVGGDTYIGGIARSKDKRYFISYSNNNVVKWSEVPHGDHGQLQLNHPGDLFLSQDGTILVVRAGEEFHLVRAADLKKERTIAVPGFKGTRHFGQSEHSSTHFGEMPRISDDNQHILCQDGSGQLWLIKADGDPAYVWPRTIIDNVEDTCWIGPTDFVAITNDGRVMRLPVGGGPAAWVQQDA
jgi:hypothetical protein